MFLLWHLLFFVRKQLLSSDPKSMQVWKAKTKTSWNKFSFKGWSSIKISRIFTKLQLAQAHISFFSQENYHQHQWIWNIDQWRPWRQRAFQRMICSYNFFEQRQKILLRQLHRPKNIVRILYLHYMYLVSTTV